MQIPIVSFLLVLGAPGTNACAAQQGALPRVCQTPAPSAQDCSHPCQDEDADAEVVGVAKVRALAPAAEGGSCTETKVDCQELAPLTVRLGEEGKLGLLPMFHAGDLALQGNVLHLDEKELADKCQSLTIEPGSTVVLKTKNGEQVVLRTQGQAKVHTEATTALPGLARMFAVQGTPAAQEASAEARVKELEARVRELEAKLRERDRVGSFRTAPQALPEGAWLYDGQTKELRKLHEGLAARAGRQSESARKQAEQALREAERSLGRRRSLWRADAFGGAEASDHARKLAEEMREQAQEAAEDAREQAHEAAEEAREWAREAAEEMREQAEELRVEANGARGDAKPRMRTFRLRTPASGHSFGMAVPPEPAEAPELPEEPVAPEPPAPVVTPEGSWWSFQRAPQPMHAAPAQNPDRTRELGAMLEELRGQMEAMRQQMQALREELERAPRQGVR